MDETSLKIWQKLIDFVGETPLGADKLYYLFTGSYLDENNWVCKGIYERLYDAQKAGCEKAEEAPWKVVNFRTKEIWACPLGHTVYYFDNVEF